MSRIERKLFESKARQNKLSLKIEPGLKDPFGDTFFDFKAKQGNQKVKGRGRYSRPTEKYKGHIEIDTIEGARPGKKDENLVEAHKTSKGKEMSPKMIRDSLREMKKRFPKAETIGGLRVTGSHAKPDRKRTLSSNQRMKLPSEKPSVKKYLIDQGMLNAEASTEIDTRRWSIGRPTARLFKTLRTIRRRM